MDPHEPREPRAAGWQQGFSDGLAQAATMVITPLLFVLLGLFLDSKLGTEPVVAVVLGVFSVVGMFLVTYYEYKAKMERVEEGKPWRRSRA